MTLVTVVSLQSLTALCVQYLYHTTIYLHSGTKILQNHSSDQTVVFVFLVQGFIKSPCGTVLFLSSENTESEPFPSRAQNTVKTPWSREDVR